MKNKVRNVLAALVLCMSAIALPVTAYASTGSDTTPPTLSATLNNDKLAVEASDDMSGVEAVYVDGTGSTALSTARVPWLEGLRRGRQGSDGLRGRLFRQPLQRGKAG